MFQFIYRYSNEYAVFFYKDGQGHVVDEELFAIEIISSRSQCLMNKPPERPIPTMHSCR